MLSVDKIKSSFKRIYQKARENPHLSEEAIKRYFYKEGILEELGYSDEDIYVEKGVKGKRTDIHCLDDYRNVVFVIEFKKPSVRNLKQHFDQLWDSYVKPLKADYGVLTNGLELLLYERINSNYERILKVNLSDLSSEDCKKILLLKKPAYQITRIDQVLEYFDKFDHPEEKIALTTEESREHFFENFKLEKDSAFTKLVLRTMELFDYQYRKSKFLTSAYDFWEKSYAKEPEEIPKNWEDVMKDANLKTSKENIFKFMFCLETTYALFTRLILAKACEDYKFPSIDFSDFIKTEVRRESYRMEISQASWPVLVYKLVENMRFKLVESIFEEDIFYWWVDEFRDLRGRELFSRKKLSREMILFGESLAKLLMTLYKFDFSEIVGDPLGTLYQKYFDKKTRKALGEFYTPKEVVSYIVDAVNYRGKGILEKRLLDPACGSGTFLVDALKRYLKASESEAKEKGWGNVLSRLCNEYHIVGFDIHPFATIMAQIQFMLVLIPYYKKAMEEERSFILKRIPIFRTDSLVDESKSERMTLKTFQESEKSVSMTLELPIRGKEGEFVKQEFIMPYYKEVFKQTDLINNEEYFSALQALFDVVKENANEEKYSVEMEKLERTFKEYLEDKNWEKLSQFFEPYGNQLLSEIKVLKYDFGDGRLVKSIEDVMLASLLKNYVKYDYVVGNPPYVRKEKLGDKSRYERDFPEIYHGDNDLCIYFLYKGINWLNPDGKFGYIISSKFTKTRYGKYIRAYLPKNYHIDQIVDLRGSKVFADVTVDPIILIVEKNDNKKINIAAVIKDPEEGEQKEKLEKLLKSISECIGKEYEDGNIRCFVLNQETLLKNIRGEKRTDRLFLDEWKLISSEKGKVFEKINQKCSDNLGEICSRIEEGLTTGLNEAFIVSETIVDTYFIERNILKNMLRGGDIERWIIEPQNLFVIYMNNIEINDYPKTEEYLLKFKEKLSKRAATRYLGKRWYELQKPRSPEVFETLKIVTPDISTRNNFALDQNNHYCLDTCKFIVLDKKYWRYYKFILGLLNSYLMEFYFKQIASYLGKEGYRYKGEYLKKLPIKIPKPKDKKKIEKEITKKVKAILSLVKFQNKIKNFPQSYTTENFKEEEFTRKTIIFKSQHKSISLQILKALDSSYNVSIEKEEPIFVDTREKAEYIRLSLEGKEVKKNEKFEILIPKSNKVVKDILKEYREDQKKLSEKSIKELEEEINQLVYKLYGLNKEDQRVIEEFLQKF